MADSLHYNRVIDHGTDNSRAKSSKKAPANRREILTRRILSIVIGGLVLVLIGEIVFHIAIYPNLQLRSVQLETRADLTVDQVMDMAGLETGMPFLSIDETRIADNLTALPEVRSAEVRRTFPDRLRIALDMRIPLAIAAVNYDGLSMPAMIDEDGVAIRIGYEIPDWSLPLVRGLDYESFGPGAQATDGRSSMLADIARMSDEAPGLLRAFSEFCIDEPYPGMYEWVLIPIHMPVKIRTSAGLTPEKAVFILKFLDVLTPDQLRGISEIDFRTGDVIYSNKGVDNDLR